MRKCIVLACPTFNLDLAGPETTNLLQSKDPKTKSRQGTGTLASPAAETGQQLRILAFGSRPGLLARRRLDPQFQNAWKRSPFDLARSRALLRRVFCHRGGKISPPSKFERIA